MPNVKTITTATLEQRLKTNQPIEFWNVLTDEGFKGELIPGSRRVPLDRVGREVSQTSLPKDAEIIVYCGGPKCPQSRLAAEKLEALGFTRVLAYEEGLEGWKNSGLALEKTQAA